MKMRDHLRFINNEILLDIIFESEEWERNGIIPIEATMRSVLLDIFGEDSLGHSTVLWLNQLRFEAYREVCIRMAATMIDYEHLRPGVPGR